MAWDNTSWGVQSSPKVSIPKIQENLNVLYAALGSNPDFATNITNLIGTKAPLVHNQTWSTITGTPTTLAGYGITDTYTKSVSDGKYAPNVYGLGTNTPKEVTDANNAVLSGWYCCLGTCLNTPKDIKYGTLLVSARDGNGNLSQKFYDAYNNVEFMRNRLGGVWSDWKQTATADMITDYGLGGSVRLIGVSLDTVLKNGYYLAEPSCTRRPSSDASTFSLEVCGNNLDKTGGTYISQRATNTDNGKVYVRIKQGTWGEWKQIPTMDLVAPSGYGLGGYAKSVTDANLAVLSGFYSIVPPLTNAPLGATLTSHLFVEALDSANIKQTFLSRDNGSIYVRHMKVNAWSEWKQIATADMITDYGLGSFKRLTNTDANTITQAGFYYLTTGCANTPSTYFTMMVAGDGGADVIQEGISVSSGKKYFRRKSTNVWFPWDQAATIGYTPDYTKALVSIDDRSTISTPTDYSQAAKLKFKYNTSIGSPDASTYSTVFGLAAWEQTAGLSGGPAHELAFTGNGGIYHRYGASSTEWKSWVQVIKSTGVARLASDGLGGGFGYNGVLVGKNGNYQDIMWQSYGMNGFSIGIDPTIDSNKLRIRRAGVDNMVINSGGYVGIGTADPKATLHSAGTTILGLAPATSFYTSGMSANQMGFYLDEASNGFCIPLKLANGTLKTIKINYTIGAITVA